MLEHGPAGEVREGDVLEADRAVAGRQLDRLPGVSATSSGSSRIWKIRSPDAVARCAWPTHIPSDRQRHDEHARGRG